MDNTLTVRVRTVYGNVTIYPESENARIFCKLLGQKSLTVQDIEHIKALGFTVQVTQEVVKL